MWLGPYEVDTVFDNETVRLVTMDNAKVQFFANGNLLRLYHKPTSKDSFVNIVIGYDL